MTWGLNLGTDDIQNAVNMATSVMKAFNNGNQVGSTGVYLDLLELGVSWNHIDSSVTKAVVQVTKPIFTRGNVGHPTGRSSSTLPSKDLFSVMIIRSYLSLQLD